jgi:hypothetical protein
VTNDTIDPSLLKDDEALCTQCRAVFASPAAFDAHHTTAGKCRKPEDSGLVVVNLLRGRGKPISSAVELWGWPGKNPTRKARRTPAQCAFDRMIERLPAKYRGDSNVQSDIGRIRKALERDRDH